MADRKKVCKTCKQEVWAMQTRKQPDDSFICISCLGIKAGVEAAKVAKVNKAKAKK